MSLDSLEFVLGMAGGLVPTSVGNLDSRTGTIWWLVRSPGWWLTGGINHMEGGIAGDPWASLSISRLFPHIAASRWLKFFQGGSGLKRRTEREGERGGERERERERERENQERVVFFIRPSLGSHIASLLPYCIWQSSHELTEVGGYDSDSWCVMWQRAGKACGTKNTAMPYLESPICSNA